MREFVRPREAEIFRVEAEKLQKEVERVAQEEEEHFQEDTEKPENTQRKGRSSIWDRASPSGLRETF